MSDYETAVTLHEAIEAIHECPDTFLALLVEVTKHRPEMDEGLKIALAGIRAWSAGVHETGDAALSRQQVRELIAQRLSDSGSRQ
jgi:hypothetical protein